MKSTIAIAILLAAILCTVAPRAAADTPAAWGPPSQGAVARLRIAEAAVDVGDPLVFRVDVRNPGDAKVTFPHMGRVEAWRLQFESEAGKLYEYSYFAKGGPARPMNLEPGATQSLELPVMKPGVVGRFAPVPGLTELPEGNYRVWAFYQFAVPGARPPQGPADLRPVSEGNQPDRLITHSVEVQCGQPEDEPDGGWTRVGNEVWQQHYRRLEGREEVFAGTLEGLPPRGPSTLMRDHGYRLGDRLIAGRGMPALDALVGKPVEVRGKRVDMNLSGVQLREIAPWGIRAAGPAKKIAPDPGRPEGAEVPPPPVVELERVRPKGDIWEGSTWRNPLVLKSAKDAAEHFEADALADLVRQVDFGRQFVLLFAWRGSGQDRLEVEVAESYPEQITFIHQPGRTRDLRHHARAYALRSNVTWRVR